MKKPHIQRAQPYDGDGWICYAVGTEEAIGETPKMAYVNWFLENVENSIYLNGKLLRFSETYL